MASQFYFPPYSSVIQWSKFDVFYDTYNGSNLVYGYATQDNIGQNPNGVFNFAISGYSRVNDVTTLTFRQTGNCGLFQPGSLIRVTGVSANSSVNYTGMVIAGGSGTCSYINPGWAQTDNAIVVGAINCPNPCWTTGWFFIPTYSSKIETKNTPFVTKLGDGYEQRAPNGLNTFSQNYSMVFQQRSDKEARAIMNFVEDAGGVRAFQVVMPVAAFNNQPLQKWVADDVSVTPASYSLNDINVSVRRVFDL